MSQAALDKIQELNHAYHMITGENAYLYASESGYSFNTSLSTIKSAGDALAHMQNVLRQAENGWTHHEIMYGKTRNQ
jgi:hypothetical protein